MQNVYMSIIIIGYNAKEAVGDCRSSVYQNISEQPFEIISVDNNVFDESQEAI